MDKDPSIAERTRTVLAGHLPGRLRLASRRRPLTVPHGTDDIGRPLLLILDAEGHPHRTATLTVDDMAPVDRAPRYGRAQVSGPLTRIDDGSQQAAAVAFAAGNPHPDLLDIGRGRSIWRMDVHWVRLDSGGQRHDVGLSDYREAAPDPLRREEPQLVADLRDHHPEFVARLISCMSADARPPLPDDCNIVRIDRSGILLNAGDTNAYLRISLPRPVDNADDFAAALHPLLCVICYGDPQQMARYGLVICP